MEKILIELAKASILEALGQEHFFNLDQALVDYPLLKENHATFITLYLNGDLRGCIGSLEAYQPLYQDIIDNSQSAAFKDNRFNPLTYKEFNKIKIEVSILTKPEKVIYKDSLDLKSKIIPFKDGIILRKGNFSSTYLPSVWEQINNFDDFFYSLAEKGGSNDLFLENNPKVYKYQVEKYSESIRPSSNSGSFYSDECEELNYYFQQSDDKYIFPRALIVPHAGYVFSGDIANVAYQYLQNKNFKRIIVIGPSHHLYFNGISGSFFKKYQTPCGNIKIDLKYLELLKKKFNIKFLEEVHNKEHSTETQMPFIKHYSDSKVIELVYGEIDLDKLSKIISFLLNNPDNLIVISTDLSHFHSLQHANALDKNCLDGIKNIDFNKLNDCEACGIIGVKALLDNVSQRKLSVKNLRYKTSFETNGDESSVVGYMSSVIY